MQDHGLDPITGVMLAGGRGQRLGGVDKGLQIYANRTLAAHVLERLRPQVGQVLISANRNIKQYASFGYPVIADVITGYAGPLAGLHAALAHATSDLVLAVPCDAPALPHDLARRLCDALDSTNATLAVARVEQKAQPTFCLVRRSALDSIERFLANGDRKAGLWLESINARYVDFDDQPEAFRNINSPEDLANIA
jgi:molybdenum cofactor guanylyltransferase